MNEQERSSGHLHVAAVGSWSVPLAPLAPCVFAAIVFALYCFTIGKVSRTYFVHQGPQERYGFLATGH